MSQEARISLPTLLWWGVSLIMVAAIIAGLVITGGPSHQRNLRMDEQRIRHLGNLKGGIDNYYRAHKRLPETLGALLEPSINGLRPRDLEDPETQEPLKYTPGNGKAYQLCAAFSAPSRREQQYYEAPGDLWEHPKGWHCFRLEVPPEPQSSPPPR